MSKTCTEAKHLPEEPHFLILVEKSVTYDDGYGDRGQSSMSTVRYLEHIVCTNQDELNAWVAENDSRRYGSPAEYRVMRVSPVRVVKHVSFEFEGS
jgi:hypothetical protein